MNVKNVISITILSLFLSQGSDSEYEVDPNRQKTHSFVNHYISDPTYYNSWRRQQKGISRAQAYNYTESESGEPEQHSAPPPPLPPLPPFPPQLSSPTPQSQPQTGSLFRPKGSRTPTPSQQSSNLPSQHGTLYRPPSSLAPESRAPIAGFSSFVWLNQSIGTTKWQRQEDLSLSQSLANITSTEERRQKSAIDFCALFGIASWFFYSFFVLWHADNSIVLFYLLAWFWQIMTDNHFRCFLFAFLVLLEQTAWLG